MTQSPCKVLHLEDNDLDAQLIEYRLQQCSYPLSIVRCKGREEYEQQLSGSSFDLILSDYRVPGFDGLEALDLAKKHQPDVPFIFVTGALGEELAVDTLRRGATDYVLKERLMRLVPAVERTLAEVEQRRQRALIDRRLRASEEKFRLLVESVTDYAIFLLDTNARVISWNKSSEKVCGWAADEVIGMPLDELLGQDESQRQSLQQQLQQWRAHGSASSEQWRTRKDGKPFWARLTLSSVRSDQGNVQGISAVLHDTTEQKQDEDRLRLLWSAAAMLLATHDPSGMMRELFTQLNVQIGVDGYLCHLAEGVPEKLRLAFHEGFSEQQLSDLPDKAGPPSPWRIAAKLSSPVHLSEVRNDSAQYGSLLDALGISALTVYPLVCEGCLVGVLSFGSRSKNAFSSDELAFLETIAHYLANAIDRMRLIDQLQEADRRKDHFLATLAHELRNPLAPVRNCLHLVRTQGDGEVREQAFEVLERQVSQMVRLIDDLLDVSRITLGKVMLQPERVELGSVVTQALEMSRPLITEMQHQLTVTMASQAIYVDADRIRLAQVFTNLINNAAKYTDSGGKIDISVSSSDSHAIVSVQDSGIGIDPAMLGRIFEPFTQVDQSLTRAQGGLGIGLTLARQLLDLQGGMVEAKSGGSNQGSEFIVKLPISAAESGKVPSSGDPTTADHQARSILVVDDNRDGANSLAVILRLMGHQVHVAYDGVEGVDAAERFRPDVVFLDIGLPRLSGYDAARRLRQNAWAKRTLMVAITGWSQEEDKASSRKAGFDLHLVKPVDPNEIEKLLRTLRCSG